MPFRAFLMTPLHCPACREVVTDQAWFAWGFCRGAGGAPECIYTVGEAIRWRTSRDGTIPAWTAFHGGQAHGGGNVGDSALRDLQIRDDDQIWLCDPCPRCGSPLDGAVVEVRDGIIVSGRLLAPGELPPGGYLVPDGDGWRETGWGEGRMDVRFDD